MTVLAWKQSRKIKIKEYEIKIEAIPAIHGINPLSALLSGKVNGYYLAISKGSEQVSIYITEDTVYKKKPIKALENKKIDLLIPNMGTAKQGSWIMILTLNANILKKMIAKLNPAVVIPVHYGTFEHYKEPIESIKGLNDDSINMVEVVSKTILKF